MAMKTERELAQERFFAKIAAQKAQQEVDVRVAAEEAFFEALGLTSAQASAVATFDKKHVLAKLMPAWVKLFAEADKAAREIKQTRDSVGAQVDEIIEKVLVPAVINRIPEFNEAFAKARDLAYEKGGHEAIKRLADMNYKAQAGINTDAQPEPMPYGVVVKS